MISLSRFASRQIRFGEGSEMRRKDDAEPTRENNRSSHQLNKMPPRSDDGEEEENFSPD
jgi:hypothetical protein